MIRRVIATASAVFVLVAAPVAAQAGTDYPAPEAGVTCSTTQVAPGATFTCTVTGAEDASAVLQATTSCEEDATIAGTVTSAPKTITGGEATFTVTAPSSEDCTIAITGFIDDVSVGEATVTVAAELSGTGFDGMPLAIGAGVLLVAGASVIFVAARRRNSQHV